MRGSALLKLYTFASRILAVVHDGVDGGKAVVVAEQVTAQAESAKKFLKSTTG